MLTAIFVLFAACPGKGFAQSATASPATSAIQIVELQGAVEVFPAGAKTWTPAQPNQVLHPLDRIHTADNSRVALRWSDQSIVPVGASTELEILPPDSSDGQAGLHLVRGILSFFHRDKPGRIRIITRGAVAGVEGTEFVLAVDGAERTTLSVVDGQVKFGNEQSALSLTNGEQAAVEPGQAPVRTAGFIANNLLQWCFYYPAVIDPDELPFTADEQKHLAGSLDAYRAGDLLAALAKFPAGNPGSDAEKIYHAALLLAVGEVEKAGAALAALPKNPERTERLAGSLHQLIAAVKRQAPATTIQPQLASEFLAASYFEQARAVRETSLQNALHLAKQAAAVSPKFGFAWERVAELEFSFGRTKDALAALDKSLALAPHNAQALALKGFILAAQNQPREARGWFDRAIAADSALGNAWLGRGLVRIRLGDTAGGRADLLVAAALEPQRAELRSYLGKAYMATGDDAHAAKELALAKKLDPNDPTAWLYSALLNQKNNEINDAVRDLEKSKALNDNRSVYRSQLLLDQDQAVRSANLAGIYRDAGMEEVALREAGKAVSADYANYSAHLFLASSYEQLRDPNWSNLRYETPAVSEFWIANLLAPTSAGWFGNHTAEQPYAKMFDQNRFGFFSDTTYLDRGAWTEQADAYYTSGDFSCDVGSSYRYDPGQRPNNDYELRSFDINLKGQLTPQDSVFLTIQTARIDYGDTGLYYNQPTGPSDFRMSEKQEPNLSLGYHHEWSPGVHTLFFASREVSDESANSSWAWQYDGFIIGGSIASVKGFAVIDRAKLPTEQYSTELQQIWETANHATIVGARYQWGDARYQNNESSTGYNGIPEVLYDSDGFPIQDFTVNFHNFNVYAYHNWQLLDSFALNVGLSYDEMVQPANVATVPFTTQERTASQLSPKVGFIWTPLTNTTLRAAYTRSLSGFINGQSMRIEPTTVAGFNQAFRSLAPESVVGDSSGAQFDTFNVSLEQKFDTGTYLSLGGELLYSTKDSVEGAFIYNGGESGYIGYPTYITGFRRTADYRECSLLFMVDQLLGKQWSVGSRYRLSRANVWLKYLDINPASLAYLEPGFLPRQSSESILQTVNLHANWNHPSGLFSRLEANWYHQNNSGFATAEPGDDFWQCNAYVGCRFWQRRAELTVGLLNVFDQNYQLEPLNLYNEMARSRTFLARLKISF